MLLIGTSPLPANNTFVTDFGTGDIGQSGWRSDDTRNAAGNNLIGGASFLNPGITHSPGLRSGNVYGTSAIEQIRSQISWRNYSGTRGNLGGLYLSGTESASGKSTISALYSDKNAGSFGAASLLNSSDFSATYRWQKLEDITPQSALTVAGVGMKFGIRSTKWGSGSVLESQGNYPETPRRSGESSWDLILVYDPTNNGMNPADAGGYYTSEVTADSKFFLFAQGGNSYWEEFYGANGSTLGIGAGSKTLAEWAATNISGSGEVGTQWGELLFGDGAEIANIQFGMGSGNANAQAQLDWAQLSFVNSGARIDFVDASLWSGTAGNGQFADAGNWAGGEGPSADRNVVFGQSGTTDVVVDGGGTVEARSIGAGNGTVNLSVSEGTLLAMRNDGFLSVENGAVLNVSGAGLIEGAALEVWGEASVASKLNLDGGSVNQPVRNGRYALVVAEGGELTLKSGADVVVANADATPIVRVGEFVEGNAPAVLNIEDGAKLTVGDAVQYGTFQVGDWGGKGIVNQSGGEVRVTGSMNIGNQGGNGEYNLEGGSLTFGGDTGPGGNVSTLTIGRRATGNYAMGDSVGVLNISGTDTELNVVRGDNNVYFLIGGNTDPNGAPQDGVDGLRSGVGVLNQTGGTVTVDEGVYFGFGQGVGTYNLEGGTLRVGGEDAIRKYGNAPGSTYAFNFGDAVLEIHSADFSTSLDIDLIDGTTPTINTAGYNARFDGSVNGADATLLKTGEGTLTLAGANGNTIKSLFANQGEVELAANASLAIGESLNVGVGEGMDAVFTQKGGVVVVTDGAELSVGHHGGSGTYHLANGQLNLGEGVHAVAKASDGDSATSGAVVIFDGQLAVQSGGTLVIGNVENSTAESTATLAQSGGTLSVANDASLYLAGQSGNSAYTLSGGVLEIGGDSLRSSYNDGSGEYAFNLAGGTIRAHGSDLNSAVNANLIESTRSTLDTNGLAVNWSGAFSGDGALSVQGGGEFNVSGDGRMGQLEVFDATSTINSGLNLGGYYDNVKGGYYGLVVNEGGTVNLENGASISVLAPEGEGDRNVHVRVGYPEGGLSAAVLNVKEGASLKIGGARTTGADQNAGRLFVGDWGGQGVVNQIGGDVGVTGALHIANQGGSGVYNMSGGTLELGRAHGETAPDIMVTLGRATNVAREQTGIMNVTGGEVRLFGNEDGTRGGRIYIGGGDDLTSTGGVGVWNQDGGVLIIDPGAVLRGSSGKGTFNLNNGGVLRIGGANALAGAYTGGSFDFNWNGGTIEIAGADFSTSNSITVAGVSGLDTGTHIATFNGNLTGTGLLGIVGHGNAVLRGTNTLAGIVLNEGRATNAGGTTTVGLLGVGYYANDPVTTGIPEFTVSDGTVNVTAPSGSGAQGDLTVGGGEGKSGQLTVSGGTLNVGDADNFGRFFVGTYAGEGTVEQTGGNVNVTGILNIGNTGGRGEYSISGGELLVGENSSAGSNALVLGRSHSAQSMVSEGILNISDDAQVTLQSNAMLYVGGESESSATQPELSKGTVNQSGGVLTLASGSSLVFGAGEGTYNLNGGTLQVGGTNAIRSVSEDYAFNLGGGTLKVTSDLETEIAMTRVVSTTSVIDTTNGDAIIHGGVGGSGSLTHNSDGGLLALGGQNTFGAGDVLRTTKGELRIGTGTTAGTLTLEEDGQIVIHGNGATKDTADFASLNVGHGAGSVGTLNINGGTVLLHSETSGARLRVGYEGGEGHGMMTGGLITDQSEGHYGVFEIGYGGNATFAQSGGLVDLENSAFHIGANNGGHAVYELSGNGQIKLGDSVTFRVGGFHENSSGELNISDQAVFEMNGADAYIGSFGATGRITQSGDSVASIINTSLSVGSSGNSSWPGGKGTYDLQSGTLSVSGTGGGVMLGRHVGTTGELLQSGGELSVSDGRTVTVGYAGTGSYALNGGTAAFDNGNLMIARDAGSTGSVIQTGGVLSVKNGGSIRFGAGSGSYTLSGGVLEVGGADAIRSGSGAYAFNLAGGRMHVRGASLSTGIDATLVADTRSVIDTAEGLDAIFSGTVSGSGDLDIEGEGRVVFAGNQTYTGETLVKAGELEVRSGLASRQVEVQSGAILSGSGTFAGDVSIQDGGKLSAGRDGIGHMTMKSLTLSEYSEVLFDLGLVSAGQGVGYDAITVLGNLLLDGRFIFNGGLDVSEGIYNIIAYGGDLDNRGVELSGLSADYSYQLQTDEHGAINLIVGAAGDTSVQYWNGTRRGITTGGPQGGSGVWDNEQTNLINEEGTYVSAWKGQHAIFSGTAGTVVLGDNVSFEALTFETSGYAINGSETENFALTATDNATVTVGTGKTAIIGAQFAGDGSVEVLGGGELRLLADNAYAGDFTLTNSRLVFEGDTTSLGGDIANNGGTVVFDQKTDSRFDGLITGTGDLHLDSATELVLGADHSYSGNTFVNRGTLTFTGDTSGIGGGAVVANDAVLRFSQANDSSFDKIISGAGSVEQAGSGILNLTAANTYTGTTTIASGILRINSDSNLGNGGALNMAGGVLDVRSATAISRNIGGSSGEIRANSNLFLGALDGSSTINTGASINAASNHVYLISNQRSVIGGFSLADKGALVAVNGLELRGGTGLATGNAEVMGRFTNNGAVVGPTGAGERLIFTGRASGAGSFSGKMEFRGGYTPGNSIAVTSFFDGDFLFGEYSPIIFEVGGYERGVDPYGYDGINITNSVFTMRGGIEVEFTEGFEPTKEYAFQFFQFDETVDFVVQFSEDRFVLPELSNGFHWDISAFATSGVLSIVVPEPGHYALFAGLLLSLGMLMRRRMRAKCKN